MSDRQILTREELDSMGFLRIECGGSIHYLRELIGPEYSTIYIYEQLTANHYFLKSKTKYRKDLGTLEETIDE
jgi:hypothetical protein